MIAQRVALQLQNYNKHYSQLGYCSFSMIIIWWQLLLILGNCIISIVCLTGPIETTKS
uniref:Uncharacterized protein n=1 Tax=Arundo donax TaxID=35708 RepID=A0A0A8XZA0_ARUDO